MKTRSILLHYGAGDDVLKGLLQFRQLIEALFDDVGRPLIDFVVRVGVSTDSALDGLFDDVADLVDDERSLLGTVEIFHCSLSAVSYEELRVVP